MRDAGSAGREEAAPWGRERTFWLGLSLCLVLWASLCSTGFYHPDEHFQTLEFAGAKLGRTPQGGLPWEFRFRIRPWLQPGIYYVLARALMTLGVEDPPSWALSFRLLSGILGWLGLVVLSRSSERWFANPELSRAALKALCLVWFLPFLMVRTSSESLSGSCFALGFGLMLAPPDLPRGFGSMFVVGLLFGSAFEFRFAVGIMVLSALAWGAFWGRLRSSHFLGIAIGLSCTLALGAGIDRWGYGEWVAPALNYLTYNVFEGRSAERFGALPFWGYFVLMSQNPMAPFVLALAVAALLAWVRHPRHPLTWAAAPFFLIHCFIPHKELRFLFPLAILAPVFPVLAFAPQGDPWDRWLAPLWAIRSRPLGRALLAANLLVLFVFCSTPNQPTVSFQRYILQRFPNHFTAYLLTPFSPYVLNNLSMFFYRPATLELHPARTIEDIERLRLPRFLVITDSFAENPGRDYDCEALYRSFPQWLERLKRRALLDRPWGWTLYRCARGRGGNVPQAFPRKPSEST